MPPAVTTSLIPTEFLSSIRRLTVMVSSQSSSRTSSRQAHSWRGRRGHGMMEVAVLLLLYTPVTTAAAVRLSQRPQTDPNLRIHGPQETEQLVTSPRLMPDTAHHQPAVPALLEDILIKSIRGRSRRAVQKGCQFGTCQVHNLASTLYNFGQSQGKQQSKNAGDPNGYGR